MRTPATALSLITVGLGTLCSTYMCAIASNVCDSGWTRGRSP